MNAAEVVASLNINPTPAGLDWLLGWARDGIEQTAEPWAERAAEVVEMAAMDFSGLESLVTGKERRFDARRQFRRRRTGWNPEPDRTKWLRMDASVPGQKPFTFVVQPMIEGPVMTLREQAVAVVSADEQRAEHAEKMMKATRRAGARVPLTTSQREAAGTMAGGRRTGASIRGVMCPSCGRRSVWWYLNPEGHTWSGAACKHRESCGWAGGIRQIAPEAGEQ